VTTVELDPGARLHTGPDGALLIGGQPLRALRLNPAAARVVAGWRGGGTATGPAETALAARLHGYGLAVARSDHSPFGPSDVTAVVPVRDRADTLDRCLATLAGTRVLVVDDGSRQPAAVAAVAARHRAELIVRRVNGGPAAARNTGLAAVRTPLVAFVDSDCRLPAGWLADLLPVLADGTAVVGPRIFGTGGPGALARFEAGSGPLDLGGTASPVGPGARVGYLPAAVLLCRRAALGAGFDEAMRVGEDVDLVWRVAAAGHPVRYEPRVVVEHETRPEFAGWLAQRFGYGRSGSALAARHPDRLAPVVISRWSVPALLCLAAGRPVRAAGCTALTAAGLWTRLPAGPGRATESVRLTGAGLGWTLLGLAEAAARPWLPALLAVSTVSGTARRITAVAVAVRLLRTRHGRSPDQHPLAWAALRVADDLAYGTGVWAGVLRDREPGPVLPKIT
jgi:mycofactocin system glycosyltransferase